MNKAIILLVATAFCIVSFSFAQYQEEDENQILARRIASVNTKLHMLNEAMNQLWDDIPVSKRMSCKAKYGCPQGQICKSGTCKRKNCPCP